MKILGIGSILAIAASLFVSTGRSEAPPAPHVAAAVMNPRSAPVPASRPSPRVARSLDDQDKDSVLGIVLLLALKRGAPVH